MKAPRTARRWSRGLNVPLVAAAVATALCVSLVAGHHRWWTLPGLDALERTSLDARFHWRGPRAPLDDRIVVVGIDDDTRRAFPETTQFRRGYARLLDALAAYHPKVIALDLFFSSPERILRAPLAEQLTAARAALDGVEAPPDAVRQAQAALAALDDELRGDDVL
ncbi:MAG: CHASE2 domain-containing protein, partial [Myxococcales bacterium]|nr:CHASE2 domain-containing protein [Myxococcales bacterium]